MSSLTVAYRRGSLVYACMAGLFAYSLFLYSIGGIMTFLRQESGDSLIMVSRFGSAVALGTLAAGVLYGRRTGPDTRRRHVLVSTAGFALSVPMVGVFDGWAAVGASFLAGLFGSVIQAAVFAALSTMRPEHTGRVLIEANFVAVAPSMVAPLAVAAAHTWLGNWRWSLLLPAVLLLAVFRRVIVAVRVTPDVPPAKTKSWTAVLILSCVVLSFASAFEFGVNYFLPSLLQDAGGLSAATATSVAGYFGAGLIAGRLVGILITRHRQVTAGVLAAAFTSAAVAAALLALAPQLPMGTVFTALAGFCAANLYPFAMAYAFRVTGDDPHMVAGRSQVFVGGLVAVAPAALALVADAVSVRVSMAIPVGLAIAAVAIIALRR